MIPFAFSGKYEYELPDGHPFPIHKYALLAEQLQYEGSISAAQCYDPGLVREADILSVHELAYWEALKYQRLPPNACRKIGLPLTEVSLKRSRSSVAGTLQSALRALDKSCAINLGGGTHHSYPDHGEGYSMLNDMAIAARYLLQQNLCQQLLFVDLDVHQGNANAYIFRDEPRVFTFSMHGERNYPLRKELSDLDIALPDGTKDNTYLEVLKSTLPRLVDQLQPELIFYQAGVDVLMEDKLGRLSLSLEGCRQRDRFVISTAATTATPLVIVLGGGYSTTKKLIEAHANTCRAAIELYSD